MKLIARCCVVLAVGAAGAPAFAADTAASYPSRPIRLVVPYPPGGGNDTLARMIGQKLGEAWGQQVVIDNRPGAGTTIGTQIAARAVPDGYTLLLSSIATHALAPNLYKNPGYDPVKDFSPITQIAVAPTVLVFNNAMPFRNLQEFIAAAKAAPGKYSYASGGSGTPPHMAGAIFASMAGINLLHVPYKGGAPAQIDTIAGQTNMMFDTAASVMPQIKGGKLKAIAIARDKRLAELPDVATFSEQGVKGYEVNAWYSMHAPAGVPKDIVAKLNREIVRIVKTPEITERIKQLGSEPVGDTPEQFAAFVRAESEKYAKAVRESGAKAE
ncbi:MAG: tripartite tricarboxylate transporter substrate binding protein [Burkholderiales bacterium]